MSKTLQFRRDTTANLSSVAGAAGEIFIDTTKNTVVVMDSATLGGTPLATEAFVTSALLRSATTSLAGTVKIDGTSITIGSGTISVPVGSSSQTGLVRADGTSILVSSGLLSLSTTLTTSLNVSGTVVMSSPFTFRNRIINGAFQIWQRGTTTSFAFVQSNQAQPYYLADRWTVNNFNSAIQSSNVPANTGLQYSLEFSATSTLTYAYASQRIESANCQDLVSSQVTLSFWALNVAGSANFYVEFQTANSVDNFSSTTQLAALAGGQFAIPAQGVWNRYVVTVPASAMVASIANGLEIRFVRDNTAVSTTRITGVQLEAGPVATPFERLPYGQILQLSQRYYQIVAGITAAPFSTTNLVAWSPLIIPMRTAPIVTQTASLIFQNYGLTIYQQSAVNIASYSSTTNTFSLTAGNFTGMTAGQQGALGLPSLGSSGYISLQAEV
jgi:hypothetical protein